jgi:hypothetical protein
VYWNFYIPLISKSCSSLFSMVRNRIEALLSKNTK